VTLSQHLHGAVLQDFSGDVCLPNASLFNHLRTPCTLWRFATPFPSITSALFSIQRRGEGPFSAFSPTEKPLPFLPFLLCLLLAITSPALASQSSGQTSAGSAATKNEIKPGEPLARDPALAPARLFLQQDKLSEAEAATRSYLLEHADSPEAHFLLSFILFREVQGKWLETEKPGGESMRYNGGDARGSLAEFRNAKAKESLAEFKVGARYHAPGAFDLKIAALDYLLFKDYRQADQWLTQSVQMDPSDAQAWFYLGRTKYSETLFREAIEAFTQCLKLMPRNSQAESNVALSYEALGQMDQAVQSFENAIAWEDASPAKDPEPFNELAHLYLEQNQPDKAVPYLQQSIAIFPNASKAHEELGKAYSLLKRLPEAQAELEKAAALEPETASLHCLLGQIYRREGMIPKAQSENDRCVALQQTQSAGASRKE